MASIAPTRRLICALLSFAIPNVGLADEIFSDGFETGDTLRWSTQTGDPTAPDLPPDPALVAPPLDLTVSTTIDAALDFLWNGPDPIQRDVDPGALEPRRIAALRGRVLWIDGGPLPGVRVSVHAADELGWTFTRVDGVWDLAVNGGGAVTVVFERDGFLPVHRTIEVDWRAWEELDDVVMIRLDPVATGITSGATEMQVARGSVVEDDDGERQATLLFPAGVEAEMTLGDGSTVALSLLTVRATESTVGADGPARMPAPLPENTGYTYAVELSVDEAIAAAATRVDFDQPIVMHLENYLGFPVGEVVPSGYYDRELALWIPSNDGRIVEILSNDGTTVTLDLNGSGQAASQGDLDELGIGADELQRLALLYSVGAQLWRVPISHFTPWDCNWPWGPPEDAEHVSDEPDPRDEPDPDPDTTPEPPNPDPPTTDEPSEETEETCEGQGSIIECENQVLREEIPLVGAPWFLAYSSGRVADRGPSVYSIPIRITGPTISSDLLHVRGLVTVAGRRYEQTFSPATNLSWTVSWDGLDRYGRHPQGIQPVVIERRFTYRAKYYGFGSTAFVRSFSRFPTGTTFAGNSITRQITITTRTTTTASRRVRGGGIFDISHEGLGGWTLSPHHRYDLGGQVVLRGDGTRRDARAIGPLARRFAGNGDWDDSGDGGPAVVASLAGPRGLAVGSDGSVYVAVADGHRVRRIRPDGVIETVAGDGEPCGGGPVELAGGLPGCGDGVPATEAQLFEPSDVAVGADGRLFIADAANACVREVLDGTIRTVAGYCSGGDGPGPELGDGSDPCAEMGCWAQQLELSRPTGVATTAGGALFVADAWTSRIWQIDASGWSTLLAGSGEYDDAGDGGPAHLASFLEPHDIVLGPEGSLYVADREAHRVRRIRPNGQIEAFAGNGSSSSDGDAGAAVDAGVPGPVALAVAADGSLYIAEEAGFTVRRVSTNGTISTVAGAAGASGENIDVGMAPEQYNFGQPGGLAMMPAGDFVVSDTWGRVLLRVAHELPPWADEEIRVLDGGEILVFDPRGRHLRTLHALTGATLLEMGYDASGHLVSVSDPHANVTTLERDADGRVDTIVGPFGQSTALGYDPNGYLETAEDPAGNGWSMVSTPGGLLSTFATPEGHEWSFVWNTDGRLFQDDDPAGGSQQLWRHSLRAGQSGRAYAVRRLMETGRETEYQRWESPNRTSRFVLRRVSEPAGPFKLASSSVKRADGYFSSQRIGVGTAWGTNGPDAQWGGFAEHAVDSSVSRGPLSLNIARSSEATLSDPSDPLSLEERTDRVFLNGREYLSHYDQTTRRLTRTSPAGRTSLLDVDAFGRPTFAQAGTLLPTTFEYDSRGRLETILQGVGPEQRRLDLAYDTLGRLAGITDPLLRTVAFNYDDANRVTSQILPDTRSIGFDWDGNGNLVGLTPPGRPEHGFGHTPVDLVAGYDPPPAAGAGATSYAYDSDRFLTHITRPDTQQIVFHRDIQGRLSGITAPRGLYEFDYLSFAADDRVLAASDPDGGAIAYGWSGPYVTSTTWTGEVAGSVSRTYNTNGWLSSRSVNGAHTASFGYDDDGLLTTAGALAITRDPANGFVTGTSLGDVTTAMTYSGFGEPESAAAAFDGTGLYQVGYTRDKLGRITEKDETVEGVTTTWTYRYDLAGRLEEVDQNGLLFAEYGFDQNGNRTSYSGFWGAAAGVYDDQDRMTSYGGASYTYTANGELLTKPSAPISPPTSTTSSAHCGRRPCPTAPSSST